MSKAYITILGTGNALATRCYNTCFTLHAPSGEVLRGWFPENPKRHEYYERRRKELGDILKEGPSHNHLKEKMGK